MTMMLSTLIYQRKNWTYKNRAYILLLMIGIVHNTYHTILEYVKNGKKMYVPFNEISRIQS